MHASIGAFQLVVVFALAAAAPKPQAPASPGAVLFENRCARCHGEAADGEGGLAPSLHGVLGRPPASRTDYVYSDGLKAKSGVWTPAMLDVYLADPQAFAPGSEMDSHSPDPAERAAIIAYIRELKP